MANAGDAEVWRRMIGAAIGDFEGTKGPQTDCPTQQSSTTPVHRSSPPTEERCGYGQDQNHTANDGRKYFGYEPSRIALILSDFVISAPVSLH